MNITDIAMVHAFDSGKYLVSNSGEVFGFNGILKPFGSKNLKVNIFLDEEKYIVPVQKIVAYKKFGLKIFDPGVKILYADGNTTNNKLSNINITSNDKTVSADNFIHEEKTNKMDCFNEILSISIAVVALHGIKEKLLVREALAIWYRQQKHSNTAYRCVITQDNIKMELEQKGLKPIIKDGKRLLYIAVAHSTLRRLLEHSGDSTDYRKALSSLDACLVGEAGPTRFAGLQKRYIIMNMTNIL